MDPCIEPLTKVRHLFSAGTTGTGKTGHAARVIHKLGPLFIFSNPSLEPVVDQICEVSTTDPEEVFEAFEEGYERIEFIPRIDDPKIGLEQLVTIQKELFKLAIEMEHKPESPPWITFAIDETHLFSSKFAQGGLNVLALQGRRHGIRGFFISPRPAMVSHTILNECAIHIYFRPGLQDMEYFTEYKIPLEEHKEWIEKEFHYVLWDGREMKECKPIRGL